MHAGANDITNGIETTANIEAKNRMMKKSSPQTKLVISKPTLRKDKPNTEHLVKSLNEKIEVCNILKLECIDNDNINDSHLSRRKLHLNDRGNSTLAWNFIKFLNN